MSVVWKCSNCRSSTLVSGHARALLPTMYLDRVTMDQSPTSSYSFMTCPLMLIEINLGSFLMVTIFTRVFNTFIHSHMVRWPFEVAWCSHSLHGNFNPSCTVLWCLVRSLFVVVLWSQYVHGYIQPSWTTLWCWVSLPLVVAWYLQSLHGYLTPSCKIAGFCCFIVTMLTGILNSFKYCSLVFSEIPFAW